MATDQFDRVSPAVAIALTVRFLLELALLAGAAILAWHFASGWWQWPAALLAIVIVATVWGLLLSPKATVSLTEPIKLVIEAALFFGIGAGLISIRVGSVGVVAAVVIIIWLMDRISLWWLGR